jgi:hypothetical protein
VQPRGLRLRNIRGEPGSTQCTVPALSLEPRILRQFLQVCPYGRSSQWLEVGQQTVRCGLVFSCCLKTEAV